MSCFAQVYIALDSALPSSPKTLDLPIHNECWYQQWLSWVYAQYMTAHHSQSSYPLFHMTLTWLQSTEFLYTILTWLWRILGSDNRFSLTSIRELLMQLHIGKIVKGYLSAERSNGITKNPRYLNNGSRCHAYMFIHGGHPNTILPAEAILCVRFAVHGQCRGLTWASESGHPVLTE